MKFGIVVLVLILTGIGIYRFFSEAQQNKNTQELRKVLSLSPKDPLPTTSIETENSEYIFVPYWNPRVDKSTFDTYDSFLYFGITADRTGKIIEDNSYDSLEKFQSSTRGKKQLLTVRLLDTDINHALLENTEAQKKLINETIDLLNRYDFDGVVLDLEMSALPLSDIQNNISLFVQRFAQSVHAENSLFAMTMYGDAYYRARPYDIKQLGRVVDEIIIMAYDFHKSRGEPGPNFPFRERSTYGYDFDAMMSDFTKDVPIKKLSVTFGMYGYDWTLGPQGKPLKSANALSLSDIRSFAKTPCDLDDCKKITNEKTKETKITYKDKEGYMHEVWFEDEESVEVKKIFLEQKGMRKIGYWVYGYF